MDNQSMTLKLIIKQLEKIDMVTIATIKDTRKEDKMSYLRNGNGERIYNPDAYYQAVSEDRYGYSSYNSGWSDGYSCGYSDGYADGSEW